MYIEVISQQNVDCRYISLMQIKVNLKHLQ